MTYSPGQSLWRAQLPHFSSFDLNWGIGPPPGAVPPSANPRRDQLLPGTCRRSGSSSIECQNQVLNETIGVVGAPFDLTYQSERVPGRRAAYTVEIPLSDSQLPAGVRADRVLRHRKMQGEYRALVSVAFDRDTAAMPPDNAVTHR